MARKAKASHVHQKLTGLEIPLSFHEAQELADICYHEEAARTVIETAMSALVKMKARKARWWDMAMKVRGIDRAHLIENYTVSALVGELIRKVDKETI